MTIDLTEPLIPLTQVSRLPFIPRRRKGKKLNVATVFRWASTGIRGVKLEVVRVGGTLCTSRAALLEFFRALTQANSDAAASVTRTPKQRQHANERAAHELKKIGI
jgi:hypothetical protein